VLNRPAPKGALRALAIAGALLVPAPALAQVRGVYPLGMSATNSGVTPEPGFTYANMFLFYARNEVRGGGEVLPRDEHGHDGHELVRGVTGRVRALGGALSFGTIPIANNYRMPGGAAAGWPTPQYQPLILAWKPIASTFAACFWRPPPVAWRDRQRGSGYWTHTLSARDPVFTRAGRPRLRLPDL
jgi:hypothetical protein